MNNKEVHERLIMWLGGLLGVPVIKDRQQAARPAKPYAMVDLANWRELHEQVTTFEYLELESENSQGLLEVKATPINEIEWVFLFFAYGSTCEDMVRKVQAAVRLPQLQEPLMPQLVIHEVSGANSIPELVGEIWEPRAQVNIVVRGVTSDGFVIDTVERHGFNITGERA